MSETPHVLQEYDWEEVQPAVAIIELIAEIEQVAGMERASVFEPPPLQRDIDTDALNTLVRNENSTSITLSVSRYYIQIRENSVEISIIPEN